MFVEIYCDDGIKRIKKALRKTDGFVGWVWRMTGVKIVMKKDKIHEAT